MHRSVPIAVVLGLLLSLSAGLAAMAHEGEEGLAVEPSSVTAGDTVVLAGSGLEPNNDRVLILAGGHLVIEFGTVRTDAEGMFSKELTIPNHLPSGNYELRAIGDETLTAPLAVTAAAGATGASPAANDVNETVVARQRSPLELGIIFGLVVVAAAAGAWLVWRAERFRGAQTA
jgi:hypothetical protein